VNICVRFFIDIVCLGLKIWLCGDGPGQVDMWKERKIH